MPRLPIVALVAFLAVRGEGVAAAQLCTGEPSFDAAAGRLYGNAMFGAAEAFHGGVVVGSPRVFGWGEIGMTTYQRDESAEYAGGVGVQLSRRPETRLHICPSVAVGVTTASDLHDTGTGPSYRETTLRVGAHAGFVLVSTKSTRVVPSAGFRLVTGRIKYRYVNGATSTSDSDSHSLFSAGVSVGYEDFTISPSVTVPVGLNGGWVAYVVTVSFTL